MDIGHQLTRSHDLSTKVSLVWRKRLEAAQRNFNQTLQNAWATSGLEEPKPGLQSMTRAWSDWSAYAFDAAQRSVLFLDAIRQRGNNYLEHVQEGQPPLLHFAYETVLDGRTFAQHLMAADRLRLRLFRQRQRGLHQRAQLFER